MELQSGEYGPHFEKYVRLVAHVAGPAEGLAEQWEDVEKFLASVPVAKRSFRYAEGKWSVQQLIGHLIDAERIFGYRALCAARHDPGALPLFDEDAYALEAKSDDARWESMVEEFAALRQANVLLFRNLPAEASMARSTVNGFATTARAWAYITMGHTAHHVQILRDRYGV